MAGAGEVGQKMVAQGWSISLDREHSLVARSARDRQGVIVNNVRKAPDWLPNPLLPDTHSELAVPIIVGERILGVLDVQRHAFFQGATVMTRPQASSLAATHHPVVSPASTTPRLSSSRQRSSQVVG